MLVFKEVYGQLKSASLTLSIMLVNKPLNSTVYNFFMVTFKFYSLHKSEW